MHGIGVIGSCRCRTSKRSRASVWRMRTMERGLRMMFGSVPFAGTITERPIGMTSGGGGPSRPCRGCSERVNWPGGSLPISVFTSQPCARSTSDCSSACSTTAPQKDHEYGTTIPTFIAAIIVAATVGLRSPHDREIFRLALPALGALAAEPLYVLADTAIVGHLGRPQIAALGLAGAVLSTAFTIFNFLAYGTTAAVARASGAGEPERAARLAAQALWVALAIGVGLVIVCEAAAVPLLRGLGGHGRSGHYALEYFRIAAVGLPAALVALAGQGYLRGVSNLRRPLEIVVVANVANLVLEVVFVYVFHWGIAGSAAGTAIAQAGMGVAFVVELLRPHAPSRRPSWREMRPLVRVGRQIFVRTLALYASFLVAASVLARMGDAELGAHQIAFQLFVFLALLLDAVAIAGQVIVGRMLGAGDADGAHAAAVRMIGWSVAIGV